MEEGEHKPSVDSSALNLSKVLLSCSGERQELVVRQE